MKPSGKDDAEAPTPFLHVPPKHVDSSDDDLDFTDIGSDVDSLDDQPVEISSETFRSRPVNVAPGPVIPPCPVASTSASGVTASPAPIPNPPVVDRKPDIVQDEINALVRDIIGGKEIVVSHPDLGRGSQAKSISVEALTAFNCARVILGKERDDGASGGALLRYMTLPESMKEILTIREIWAGDAQLDAENILGVPIFRESFKRHQSHRGVSTAEEFRSLLSQMQDLRNSAALVITRGPYAITCFKVSIPGSDAFVVFDSHPPPWQSHGPCFVFNASLHATAEHLESKVALEGSSDGACSHLLTASDFTSVPNLENTKLKLLEMNLSSLLQTTTISDLEARIKDLNQSKTYLDGEIAIRESTINELCRELNETKTERDFFNELVQNGLSSSEPAQNSDGDPIALEAVIASLEAEVERLRKVIQDQTLEAHQVDTAKVESLKKENSYLRKVVFENPQPTPPPMASSSRLRHATTISASAGSQVVGSSSGVGKVEMDPFLGSERWKHCPVCGIPARKDTLNHLTCGTPGCNTHFCFACNGVIAQGRSKRNTTEAVNRHYETCALC